MEEFLIESAQEMVKFGASFGRELSQSSVLAIVGDLGAGKTHFCKGVCEAFGYPETTSPTYTLVNEMVSSKTEVYHFDFYRIKNIADLWEIGWEDYLEKDGVILAEWADLFPEAFPENTIWLKISHEPDGRKVTVKRP